MKTLHHALVAVAVSLPTALAWAGNDGFGAPTLEVGVDWKAWMFSLVFILAVVVVAFKNARRTHMG